MWFVLGWRWHCFHIHVSGVLSASLRQLSVPFHQWQDCGTQHALQHEWLMQTTVLCYCLLCCLHWCCVCCIFKAPVMCCSVNCTSLCDYWMSPLSLSISSHESEILKTVLVALFYTITKLYHSHYLCLRNSLNIQFSSCSCCTYSLKSAWTIQNDQICLVVPSVWVDQWHGYLTWPCHCFTLRGIHRLSLKGGLVSGLFA